jgi:hypothetical protein
MKTLMSYAAGLLLAAAPLFAQTFTNFELSKIPTTACPGSPSCYNGAAEPAIRADSAGSFYGSSENGLGSGTLAWRSLDGGLHYTALVSPNSLSQATDSTFQPGGGDTDLAVGTGLNSQGFDSVYVSSLTLANIDVSASLNQGGTWNFNPLSATLPGDDREWIAADGANKVCISYREVAGTQLVVNCSYDGGQTFTQVADVYDVNHQAFAAFNAEIGNLAIDANNHYIYQSFAAVRDNNEALTCPSCNLHVVWVGVSTDGGNTFTDYPVYINPDTTVGYNHNFTNVSVDRAGNVYSVYSDNHNVYYSFSTNHGQTWSGPYQVNKSTAKTAIYPWSTAGANGKIDIVWYGSSYYDGVNPPDNYPSNAVWNVYFAQNLRATTPGSTFTQTVAATQVHTGAVCEGGVSCTGNRDLYDDFGVAASPSTGMASIIYSDDQYTNTAKSPPQPGCTAAVTNTVSCDHTSIATQISGSGIF